MSTFIDKARMHARNDGIEMKINDDCMSVNLVMSNEALWNIIEFIMKDAPVQREMMFRIIKESE